HRTVIHEPGGEVGGRSKSLSSRRPSTADPRHFVLRSFHDQDGPRRYSWIAPGFRLSRVEDRLTCSLLKKRGPLDRRPGVRGVKHSRQYRPHLSTGWKKSAFSMWTIDPSGAVSVETIG